MRTQWPERRLDEILSSAPCRVECTDDDSATRVAKALRRRMEGKERRFQVSVSGNVVRLIEPVDPIVAIQRE